MIKMLEELRELRKVTDEEEVAKALEVLGETYSIPLLEALLKHYKEKERQILTKDLLEWMQENDQTSFENNDLKVSIRTFVGAKITDTEKAFHWLEEKGYGDSIKDTLEFAKGEFSMKASEMLHALGLSWQQKRGIHPQSLKKIMSLRLETGEDLPYSDGEEIGDGIKVNYFDECVVKNK